MTFTWNSTDFVQPHDSSVTGAPTVDNIRIDLPMYRCFNVDSGSSQEIVCHWKKWKSGLEFYIDAIGINKKEKKRLRSMVLYLLGEECLDIYMTLIDRFL